MSSIFPTSNGDALKFENAGEVFSGVLIEPPTQRQLTEFKTNTPRLDKNGNPMMGIKMVLQDDEGATKTVYADSKTYQRELGDAIRASGAGKEEIGGRFTIKYLGKQDVQWSTMPVNMHEITYEPPAPGSQQQAPAQFPGGTTQAPPQAAQQPPVGGVAQQPPVAQQAPQMPAQQPPVSDPWGGGQPAPAQTNPWG